MTTPTAAQLRTFADSPAAFQEALVIPSASGPKPFGDCMADFQRERFAEINPALLAVAKGEKPSTGRYWWEATKGASKDSDLAVCLLWLLAFTRRPLTCQVGAADQAQAAELRKAAKDILRLNPWLAERVDVQSWKVTCEGTDSVCEIIAADVAGSHGARPDVLILNELSHVTRQEFAENLMDNAAKVPHGLAVVATNAGFLDTWQARWREIALTSALWLTHIFAQPSPWLDHSAVEEAARRNTQARYLRLWHGVWSDEEKGDALPVEAIKAAVTLTGPCPSFMPELSPFVGALDLGLKKDHSALVVLGTDSFNLRMHLVRCKSWKPPPGGQVSLEDVRRTCLEMAHKFALDGIVYDPWQAELMAEQLRGAGVRMIPWPFVPANLDLMATALLEAFTNREIALYPDADLLRDLNRISIVERQSGYRLKATRDEHGHADRATALAMAIPFARQWAREVQAEREADTNHFPTRVVL